MRSKEQKIAVADRLLEAYRAKQPGYRKTYRGHYAPRDEPDNDNNPEVRAHNAAVAKRLKRKRDARAELKKKDAVPKKSGKPMFENSGNNFAAKQSWGKSLVGQTFYTKCPDDSRFYKTIFIRFNPFTNAMQPMISNKIYGEPPDTMEQINPLILQRLLRLQQTTTFEGF